MSLRYNRRAKWIVDEIQATPETEILDLGCGTGEFTYYVAKETGAKVLGLDCSPLFIDTARNNYPLPNIRFETIDFRNSDQTKHLKFDYIVGNGILHHLYYGLEETIESLNSLLRPGGKIVFFEPNLMNPYCFLIFRFPFFRKLAKLEPDEMAFSRRFATKQLLRSNFKDINVEYRDFLVPIAPKSWVKAIFAFETLTTYIPILKPFAQSLFICAEKAA